MSFLRYHAAIPSLAITVIANLVPLYGVLAWGWDLFSLILLYWLETAVIGLFAVARMALGGRGMAIPLIAFFVVHFGIFMTVHLFLVISLFGGGDGLAALGHLRDMLGEREFLIAIAALIGGHLVSFIADGAPARAGKQRSWDRRDSGDAMKAAYGRVFVTHLTILIGAALVMMLNARAAAFATLVALKTGAEILAEIRAQPKRSAPAR